MCPKVSRLNPQLSTLSSQVSSLISQLPTLTPSNFAPSAAQRAPSSLTLRGLRANLQFTIYVLFALRPTFIL